MKKENLISVIVPVYNMERYLEKCLDSITGQSYQNLEIILVDDASEDNSGKICDRYAAKDGRIKVIHRRKNGGLSAARNSAPAPAVERRQVMPLRIVAALSTVMV